MKKVICVVEDEKAINDLVAQYLKKEGYEVRSYYTYEEASEQSMVSYSAFLYVCPADARDGNIDRNGLARGLDS